MPKYCNSFQLEPADVDLIEGALRKVINREAELDVTLDQQETQSYIRSLNEVLGKLHNQKVFYSQVNNTGTPAG